MFPNRTPQKKTNFSKKVKGLFKETKTLYIKNPMSFNQM